MINARMEMLVEKPAFRSAFARRRAVSPACAAARVAAALRRSSREIVDGERLSLCAISRTPWPSARQSAISSRSAKDRSRPASGSKSEGGMPPHSRNQRLPTAGDTPAATPACSLVEPAAISCQNR
jgi:hypothetical protein